MPRQQAGALPVFAESDQDARIGESRSPPRHAELPTSGRTVTVEAWKRDLAAGGDQPGRVRSPEQHPGPNVFSIGADRAVLDRRAPGIRLRR